MMTNKRRKQLEQWLKQAPEWLEIKLVEVRPIHRSVHAMGSTVPMVYFNGMDVVISAWTNEKMVDEE